MILGRESKVFKKVLCPFSILILFISISSGAGIADKPFVQEYHEAFPLGEGDGKNDVRAIAVDRTGVVWAGTRAGVYRLDQDTKQWNGIMSEQDAGPIYDIVVDRAGIVWIGAWNGLYRSSPDGLRRLTQIDCPMATLCAASETIIGLGGGNIWRVTGDSCTYEQAPCSKHFRAVLLDKDGGLWIATGVGLYHHADSGYKLFKTESELLGPDVYDIAYAPDGTLWIGGLGGITLYKESSRIDCFTPGDGLPSIAVQCIAQGPDGLMWVGMDHGVARYDGRGWSLRHSRRWLLSDDVRDIAFDSKGTA